MKAIIFDMDGVILESALVKTDAFADLFGFCDDETIDKILEHHIKNGGVSRYKKIKHYYKEFLNKELTEKEIEKIAEYYHKLVIDKVLLCPFVEGVKKFIENNYMHNDIDLFIVSGTPTFELKEILEKKGLTKYFKAYYGTTATITKANILDGISYDFGYHKKDMVYIGDSLSDYLSARSSGVKFIGRLSEIQNHFPIGVDIIKNFKGEKLWFFPQK